MPVAVIEASHQAGYIGISDLVSLSNAHEDMFVLYTRLCWRSWKQHIWTVLHLSTLNRWY